jgi:hypothetical protein
MPGGAPGRAPPGRRARTPREERPRGTASRSGSRHFRQKEDRREHPTVAVISEGARVSGRISQVQAASEAADARARFGKGGAYPESTGNVVDGSVQTRRCSLAQFRLGIARSTFHADLKQSRVPEFRSDFRGEGQTFVSCLLLSK